MKNIKKTVVCGCSLLISTICLIGCNPSSSSSVSNTTSSSSSTVKENLRFAFPDGTPALAVGRLAVDNLTISGHEMNYQIVSTASIATEMSSKSADLVIMPINGGANLIRQGAEYKLASVAVDGSLFVVGKGEATTIGDLSNKKVACIGQFGTPGLITRYILSQSNIHDVDIQYVADGPAARTLLASNQVDYAIVGEPAATAFSKALEGVNICINMQEEYKKVVGDSVTTYPQAGLFVKNALAEESEFMTELYSALKASKEWITSHPSEVTTFVQESLGSTSTFPAPSIPNCAISAEQLTTEKKTEVIEFLTRLVPTAESVEIDWTSVPLFA